MHKYTCLQKQFVAQAETLFKERSVSPGWECEYRKERFTRKQARYQFWEWGFELDLARRTKRFILLDVFLEVTVFQWEIRSEGGKY